MDSIDGKIYVKEIHKKLEVPYLHSPSLSFRCDLVNSCVFCIETCQEPPFACVKFIDNHSPPTSASGVTICHFEEIKDIQVS